MLGRKHTHITKQKIRAKLYGRRWMPIRLCLICGKDGVRSGRQFCSRECSGKSRLGKSTWMKGKKHTESAKRKISLCHKGKRPHNYGKPNLTGRGENCHLWKGGVTEINAKVRTSIEYRNWRRKVFKRDNYTCQECKKRGGNIFAHHKKDFALYQNLRFKVSNGITLCLLCHKKTDSYPKNLH